MNRCLLLLCTMFAIGCSSKSSVNVLIPSAVGNSWTFVDSTFQNDTLLAVSYQEVGISGDTIVKWQNQQHQLFYWNWKDTVGGTFLNYKYFRSNESDGMYEWGGKSLSGVYLLGKYLREKYPVSSGDSWNFTALGYAQGSGSFLIAGTDSFVCESTSQQIITPIGSLNCIVYRRYLLILDGIGKTFLDINKKETPIRTGKTAGSHIIEEYYCPDIGYVGNKYFIDGQLTFSSSLFSYNVK